MENQNYRLPFNPKAAMMSNASVETCSTGESIAQNIMLLIITKKGENRFDENYGNEVWSLEFDNGITPSAWENIFVKSLTKQIRDYEPRIKDAQVNAKISFVEHNYDTRNFTEVKKRAKIIINAKMESSGENFNFSTELFLSPMSIE